MFLKCLQMDLSAVAFMSGEFILGIILSLDEQESVSFHLGEDTRGGNRVALGVSFDDPFTRFYKVRDWSAIDEAIVRGCC